MPDDKRFVPDFQLVVDGQAADPELKGSIVGIRVTDDMDKASRFWLHLSDVGRKWTRQQKFKPGTAIEIKLGYQGQLKSVCKGEVSNIEIVLTADGPSRLVVAGVDKGHGFDKGTVTKTYKNVKDSDLATQIARRHNVCVVAASQLSRAGQLRWAGELDQDAFVILRLTRKVDSSEATVSIVKNRNGRGGAEVAMYFDRETAHFTGLVEEQA